MHRRHATEAANLEYQILEQQADRSRITHDASGSRAIDVRPDEAPSKALLPSPGTGTIAPDRYSNHDVLQDSRFEYISQNYINQSENKISSDISYVNEPLRRGDSFSLPLTFESNLHSKSTSREGTLTLTCEEDGSLSVTYSGCMNAWSGGTGPSDLNLPLSKSGDSWTSPQGDRKAIVSDFELQNVPVNTPRATLALAAFSGLYATNIAQQKLARPPRSRGHSLVRQRDTMAGKGATSQSSHSTKPGTKAAHGEDCCVQHDFICTDPAATVVTVQILWCKARVDLSECCIRHDIAMWCGPKKGSNRSKSGYAWESSAVLGACVFSKFANAFNDHGWFCRGIGTAYSAALGVIFGFFYFTAKPKTS